MPPARKFDLDVEVDVLTAGSLAEIVNAILEFLLYQRNQIPLVFKTYNYFVSRWSINEQGNQEVYTTDNFQLQRQKEQAIQTKEAISAMRELIYGIFDKNSIKCLRFLFGATTFTPKEVYTIHIPTESVSRDHYYDRHRISHSLVNQTVLTLLSNEELYPIFSNNLSPTNLYLELEILEHPNLYTKNRVFPKDICQLPPSCKDIHLHIKHTSALSVDIRTLKCCDDQQIFQDVDNDDALTYCSPAWWEADVIVRGFREKIIKGVSIWTK